METGFLFRGSNLRVGCQQSGCSKKHYVHCEKSMSIVYLVRKKVFRTAEGVKQLVQSVLIDLPKFIEEALMEGESVTIKGLGSFHVAVTSDGFEHPDDVMPGKVRLSRVYFRPDKSLVARLNSGMDFYRYPLSRYFPHDMLRPETLRKERAEGKTGIPDEDPVGMENDTEDFSGEE